MAGWVLDSSWWWCARWRCCASAVRRRFRRSLVSDSGVVRGSLRLFLVWPWALGLVRWIGCSHWGFLDRLCWIDCEVSVNLCVVKTGTSRSRLLWRAPSYCIKSPNQRSRSCRANVPQCPCSLLLRRSGVPSRSSTKLVITGAAPFNQQSCNVFLTLFQSCQ